ncbi:hypothetical protein BKA69DRAFT_308787 [Paraphysoderma sedebokerense]|nr:hypothetical protein BKA69DRAFT_308787 [Paraphysoderma sedebokerense]
MASSDKDSKRAKRSANPAPSSSGLGAVKFLGALVVVFVGVYYYSLQRWIEVFGPFKYPKPYNVNKCKVIEGIAGCENIDVYGDYAFMGIYRLFLIYLIFVLTLCFVYLHLFPIFFLNKLVVMSPQGKNGGLRFSATISLNHEMIMLIFTTLRFAAGITLLTTLVIKKLTLTVNSGKIFKAA